MYRVLKGFFDAQDADRWYDAGDQYPREGYKPTAKRIEELSGANNRQRTPLIAWGLESGAESPDVKKPVKAARKKKDD